MKHSWRFRLKQRTTTRFMDILQRTKSGKYTIPICVCLRHEYCNQFLWSVYWISSGAIALSKYNYRSDSAAGKTSGTNWWYTWENQCSVYNTASTDGANTGAGHSGSNFAVVYGYSDFGNTEWMAKPEFYFDSPRKFKGLWYCNTAYTYGVIIMVISSEHRVLQHRWVIWKILTATI